MRISPLILALVLVIALALGWWVATVTRPSPAEPTRTEQHEEHAGEHEEHAEHEEEHGEHKEGHIELTPEQVKRAGVVVETVQSSTTRASFTASGNLAADPEREVHVSAPVSGRVLEVAVTQGTRVRPGDPLLTLSSPELARAKADYNRARVELAVAEKDLGRRRSLAEIGDATRLAAEEARVQVGTAQAELESARAQTDVASRRLKRLEELKTDGIASDQQVEEARGTLRQARASVLQAEGELKAARLHLAREEKIQSLGLVANREVAEAEAAVARAASDVQHARDVIVALGGDPDQPGPSLTLTAPMTGTVIAREVARGESVETGKDLLTVLESSRLWLWISIPEARSGELRPGSGVRLRVAAFPKRTLSGQITYVDPQLDPATRSLRAKVELENPNGQLRPNMFAEVEVLAPGSEAGVSVPITAVASVEGQDVVYVHEEPGHFERRPVELGPTRGERVLVTGGLEPGEEVATGGVFSIKSEDLRDTMGEGHDH